MKKWVRHDHDDSCGYARGFAKGMKDNDEYLPLNQSYRYLLDDFSFGYRAAYYLKPPPRNAHIWAGEKEKKSSFDNVCERLAGLSGSKEVYCSPQIHLRSNLLRPLDSENRSRKSLQIKVNSRI